MSWLPELNVDPVWALSCNAAAQVLVSSLLDSDTALLLMFGGWVNPLPYLLRGFGLNAFVMGGSWVQRLAAGVAGVSVAAILLAWVCILRGMARV